MIPNNFPIQSTVPVSSPITYSGDELVDLNGFAWTNTQGIVIKSNPNAGQTAISFMK